MALRRAQREQMQEQGVGQLLMLATPAATAAAEPMYGMSDAELGGGVGVQMALEWRGDEGEDEGEDEDEGDVMTTGVKMSSIVILKAVCQRMIWRRKRKRHP